MNASEAAAILNGMTYKPDSQVEAWPVDAHTVGMALSFRSYDSTPERDGSYRPATVFTPPITINVRDLDAEGVMGAGLYAAIQVEIHETREFWRQNHGRAPFHPHNVSGEIAWQKVRNMGDLVTVSYPEAQGR